MSKQQFLDQEATSTEMAATQELLRSLNQTQIINAIRTFKAIDSALYKSIYKELPFYRVYEALLAVKLITNDDAKNNMEN